MAQRVLELTLVSASKLKHVNMLSDMKAYAVVSINGDPSTQQRTNTDREGRTDPTWGETLWFAVPPTAAAGSYRLHVLLRTERLFGDDRDVGEVFIPLADLVSGFGAGATQPQCATYHVQKVKSTQRRGTLSVSYRVGPGPMTAPLPPDTDCWDGANKLPPLECYPPTYTYSPERQKMAPRYPPAGVRMPPAPEHGGFGAAAAPFGTKNMQNNDSFSLGHGAALLR